MGPRRLLIATGEAASDTSELPFGTQLLIDAADEILVIVPALPTRLAWLASTPTRLARSPTSAYRGC